MCVLLKLWHQLKEANKGMAKLKHPTLTLTCFSENSLNTSCPGLPHQPSLHHFDMGTLCVHTWFMSWGHWRESCVTAITQVCFVVSVCPGTATKQGLQSALQKIKHNSEIKHSLKENKKYDKRSQEGQFVKCVLRSI